MVITNDGLPLTQLRAQVLQIARALRAMIEALRTRNA